MSYGYIYLTHCSKTDKYYIGQHKWDIEKHKLNNRYPILEKHFKASKGFDMFAIDSNYLGSGKLLNKDIEKYGRKYFYIADILAIGKNKEELDELERYYIDDYYFMGFDLYNLSKGGNGGNVIKNLLPNAHKAFCDKQRELTMKGITPLLKYCSKPGKLNGMYGKHHSEESKLKNRISHLSKKASKETRLKMAKSHNPNNKPPNPKGKIKMFINDSSKWINLDEQIYYENLGYSRHSKLVNNGVVMKRISIKSLDNFLSNGWVLGKIKKEKNIL